MRLLLEQKHQTQFVCVVILVMNLLLIGNVHSEKIGEGSDNHKFPVETSKVPSVKKALKETPPPPVDVIPASNNKPPKEKDGNTNDVKVLPEGVLPNEKPNNEQKAAAATPPLPPKETDKTGIRQNSQTSTTDKKNSTITQSSSSAATTSSSSASSSFMYHQGESILNSNEEISDSLKTGFYFFVALSLSAIAFIVFKVYRLRLSRAERKYGVQGDRSTQELTPLPIAIDDGPSDDEDQTLFDVQRQNIRIL